MIIKELELLTHAPSYHDDLAYSQHTHWHDAFVRIDGDFTADDGSKRQVQDSAGVKLIDSTGEPSNLIIYPNPNISGNVRSPYLLEPYQGQAMVLGDVALCTKIHAVIGFDNADALYDAVKDDFGCVVCLPRLLERHLTALATHWGKLNKPLAVYAPLTDKQRLESLKTAVNGVLYLTIADLQTALANDSLDDVCEQSDKVELSRIQWQTPKPLPQKTSQNNPYPIHAFGDDLGAVVKQCAHYAQVPLSWAGQSVLGALSTVGQCFIDAPLLLGQYTPVNLWLLTQGKSGAGKTALQDLTYNGIYQFTEYENKRFEQQIQAYNEYQSLPPKQRKEFTEPKEPIDLTPIFTDATIEKILDRYVHDGIKNLSLVSDDGGKFFHGHSMKSDTAGSSLASLTNIHSSGRVDKSRVGSNKTANKFKQKNKAYRCRLTMDIAVQPVIMQGVMSDSLMTEQGFLARFLVCYEPSLIGARQWNTPERLNQTTDTDPILNRFWQWCYQLLDTHQQQANGTHEPPSQDDDDKEGNLTPFTHQERIKHPFRRMKDGEYIPPLYDENGVPNRQAMKFKDRQTLQKFADFQQSVEVLLADGKLLNDVSSFASRMAENASRIASLLAFYDGEHEITPKYLDNAFALVWYGMNELLGYDDTQSESKSDEQMAIDWLVKECQSEHIDRMAYKEVGQNITPKPLRNGKRLAGVMEILEYYNHIQIEYGGKSGRAREIIINPYLLGKVGK